MKKLFGLFLIVVLLCSLVFAQTEGWDEFEDGGGVEPEVVANDSGVLVSQTTNLSSSTKNEEESGTSFTNSFYLALVFGLVALIILIILAFLLFRKPKDRWKK